MAVWVADTADVATLNVAELCWDGTKTVPLTVAALLSLCVCNTRPEAGALLLRVTVAVAGFPPITDPGLTDTLSTVGGVTCKDAV